MKPTQQAWRSVPHPFQRQLLPSQIARLRFQTPPIRHSSSSPVSEPKVDQTKESNDPSKAHRSEHESQAQKAEDRGGESHPAKQPDPQQAPSKATGIEPEGPDSRAGEGKDTGVMEDRGAGPHMKQ